MKRNGPPPLDHEPVVSSSDPTEERDTPGPLARLPLGSNAYRSPLFAARDSSRTSSKLAAPLVILGVSVTLSVGLVMAAWLSRSSEVALESDGEVAARAEPPAPAARAKVTATPDSARRASKPLGVSAASVTPVAVLPEVAEVELAAPAAARRAVRAPGKSRRVAASARTASVRRESRAAGARADLPETPARSDVLAAITRVTPAAKACLAGIHDVAKVTFFVRGKTGRVTTARVHGVTGAAGSCIARAVRRAKFPPFRKDRFEISYPFRR